jgi:hypothetical protein
VHLERLLERPVQPAQHVGPFAQLEIAGLLEWRQSAVRLAAAMLEQRAELDRRRLDVELKRLARRGARDQLPEGVADLGALGVPHHERVLGRHAQVAHQRPLARDKHAGAAERLHGQQLARLRQLFARPSKG